MMGGGVRGTAGLVRARWGSDRLAGGLVASAACSTPTEFFLSLCPSFLPTPMVAGGGLARSGMNQGPVFGWGKSTASVSITTECVRHFRRVTEQSQTACFYTLTSS